MENSKNSCGIKGFIQASGIDGMKKSIEAYVSEKGAEVIVDKDSLTVIKDKESGVKIYAFYGATDGMGIVADGVCLVHKGDDWVTVSDPTCERDSVRITVLQTCMDVVAKNSNVGIDIVDARTHVTVDTSKRDGAEFFVKYKTYNPTAKYRVYHTDEEYNEFVEMTKCGLSVAFIYSNKLIIDGKSRMYNDADRKERAVAKGGVVYVPVSFFEKYLGKTLDGVDESLFYVSDGRKCVNALECAKALGLVAETFYNDRLFVVGSPEQIEKIRLNSNLAEAGAYAVFGGYDTSGFKSEDYKFAKDEWRLRIVGSPEINDLNDEAISAKIKARNAKYYEVYEAFNKESDRVALFGKDAPVESADLTTQYRNLVPFAHAWGTYGCEKYHDPETLAIILDSLEWMYENMYGEAEIEGRGWRNVREFNWWDWFYGAPDLLTDIMLIVEDYLSYEQKEKYLKCYRWVRTIMYATPNDRSGSASRTNPGAKCALLLEDPAYLERLQVDCDNSMSLSEFGGVHQADYVNWTHNMPHNISYGAISLQRALFVSAILASTPLDITGPKAYNQFGLIKYCYEPAIYNSQGFMMFSGRSTFGCEQGYGQAILSAAIPMIGRFGEDEDNYIKRFIKRNVRTEELKKSLKAKCSLYDCAKLNAILNDDTITAENDYEYAHSWFTGDRAAQHRNDYAVGIAMSSAREQAYECINSANKTGWHTGDGALYLYTNYDGNQFDGKNFIFNDNVAYRYPGTTEDSRPRVKRSISTAYHWLPKNTFAGSMQLYDKYIAASMDFISYHNEGPDVHPDDYGYGGSCPIHYNDLRVKKSWFCLGEEILCLGAGISSTMNSPVKTTVEHRRIVNPETDNQYANGTLLPKESYEKSFDSIDYAVMEDHAGYVFFDKKAYINRYEESEVTGQTFFEVGISHGENPDDATYAYAILPYADNDKLASYAKAPGVEIISNTKSLQAIKDNKTSLSCYVFHEAGEFDGIRVSAPCILAVGERDGEFTLSVTEPTQKLERLTVSLACAENVRTKNPKISVNAADGGCVLDIDVLGAHGRKFEVKYNK